MALATGPGGELKTLNDLCRITISGKDIVLKIRPEISDTKKATFADATIIGRSAPIKTYSHSDNRVITMKLHFLVVEEDDIEKNIRDLWLLESAVYPRHGGSSNGDAPFLPPPICKLNCGQALGSEPLCCVLENYSVTFPTNVACDPDTLLPYYFEVTTSWHVVYTTSGGSNRSQLPNQERIMNQGM